MGIPIKRDDVKIRPHGRRIIDLLDAREWTLAELQIRCGREGSWIYHLIRKDAVPYADALVIAKVLSVKASALFREERPGLDEEGR